MSVFGVLLDQYVAPDALVDALPAFVASPLAAMKWASVVAFAPQVAKVLILSARRGKGRRFDNNAQRPQLARERAENPYGVVASLQAAHENSLETLVFFFGGALAARYLFVGGGRISWGP